MMWRYLIAYAEVQQQQHPLIGSIGVAGTLADAHVMHCAELPFNPHHYTSCSQYTTCLVLGYSIAAKKLGSDSLLTVWLHHAEKALIYTVLMLSHHPSTSGH